MLNLSFFESARAGATNNRCGNVLVVLYAVAAETVNIGVDLVCVK